MHNVTVHQTTSGRAGRRFEPTYERALYDYARMAASSLPGSAAGVLLIPEMTGPIGVPDFVAVVGGRTQISARASSGIPPITGELECAILGSLYTRRPRSATSISRALGVSEAHVGTRLEALTRIGAVARPQPGRYVRSDSLTPAGTVYAIEAKVRDWRRALRQARGYRTWANNYVLVLGPLGAPTQESLMAEVRSDSAGLHLGGRWSIKPTPMRQDPTRAHLAFEYLAAAVMDSSPRLP